MHEERDAALRKELNGSAAWLAGLSPIRSPAPRTTLQSTLPREEAPHSSFLLSRRGHLPHARASPASQPRASHQAPPPPTSMYPHLVRSRSPPGCPPTPPSSSFSATQLDMSTRVDAQALSPGHDTMETNARVRDTFADVLAREWPFETAPSDSHDFSDAVSFGRESALVHYANGGFKEVSSQLAQEAGAVSMEAARYRLNAQHSTTQCREAMKTYTQTREELADAQRQLQSLLAKEEDRKAASVESAKQTVSLNSPSGASVLLGSPAAPDTSVGALTLQLDQELTDMRAQKQRYELLGMQKARLQSQVEDWAMKEKKLVAKLDRVQLRRGDALEGLLRRARDGPSPSAAGRTQDEQHSVLDMWGRDFDVCITERVELLRHLQGGSAKRFEQLKLLLARLHERSAHGGGTRAETPTSESPMARSASSAVEDKAVRGQPWEQPQPSATTASNGAVSLDTTQWLLDNLAKVHQSVSLGEEEALAEMEHLRVLLQRLQRQERNEAAALQQASQNLRGN